MKQWLQEQLDAGGITYTPELLENFEAIVRDMAAALNTSAYDCMWCLLKALSAQPQKTAAEIQTALGF